MRIDNNLKNKIAKLAYTEEWKEVYKDFFIPKLDELLSLGKDVNILPEKLDGLNLDYKDNLLCRQIAGRYLKEIFFLIDISKEKTNVSK